MIGIYRIRNIYTNECYVGQSKDIEQRFKEHLYHKDSYIDRCIHEVGEDKFEFEIVEECPVEKLDEREEYYIRLYNSTNILAYNLTKGGKHCRGESNANSKLREQDVYDIRESYNNHETKFEVYKKYQDKITQSSFSSLWEGNSWSHVHMDVYTEENKRYYKYETCIGRRSDFAIFTDEEVIQLRQRYVNETADQIYESVKDRCTLNALKSILSGNSYKDLPIYSKREQKWINI